MLQEENESVVEKVKQQITLIFNIHVSIGFMWGFSKLFLILIDSCGLLKKDVKKRKLEPRSLRNR